MLRIEPGTVKTSELHEYMLGAVAPRPIAFASTISADGIPNLAPFSFFNAIGSKPPFLVFSANRRVRDNSTKDTYTNIKATGEVVINMVSYAIVRNAALCSIEYPASVSEFQKAGLTPLLSEKVKPFRVQESPVQMECIVREVIEFGNEGGAANLFVCEILLMHIAEAVLDANGKIDPHKIDLCARMGQSLYCRASGSAVFEIKQPVNKIGIGMDQLPAFIRENKMLTGFQIAQLASVEQMPDAAAITQLSNEHPEYSQLLRSGNEAAVYQQVKALLDKDESALALALLLAAEVDS